MMHSYLYEPQRRASGHDYDETDVPSFAGLETDIHHTLEEQQPAYSDIPFW